MINQNLLEFILYSVAIFVSTNLDDIFILLLFFGEAKYKVKDILIGQLLGIASLVALSIMGGLVGLVIPSHYLGLLGLLPIYLGIMGLIKLRNSAAPSDEEVSMLKPYNYQFLFITSITIANGGDNVGIYVPVFSRMPWIYILIMVLVFTLMTLLWCLLAFYLTAHPKLTVPIKSLSGWITPILLILLGAYILYQSQAIHLLDLT